MIDVPSETRHRQRLATDPGASVFVSANAGSGKTYVLSRRVIRLLLAGVDPGRILCLTFTKAAAAEMANRVFDVLGRWAVLPDAALVAEIADLEGTPPRPDQIAAARRLFARALETPGGLKVQTIHAFCEALLQRFSLEANLSGRFEVLDDRGAALLLAEAKAETVRLAALEADGPLGTALATLLALATDAQVDAALKAAVREREAFAAWIAANGTIDAAIDGLAGALGAPPGATLQSLDAAVLAAPDFDGPFLSRLIPVLDGAGTKAGEMADSLRAALAATDPAEKRALWAHVFLTADRVPKPRKDSAIVKAVEEALPGTKARFAAEADRLSALNTARAAVETAARTAALARVADRAIGLFEAMKARDGMLDYDDLIARTAALLSRADAAAWVQYKLDQGLDHVLVDEAQDTSPRQWQIVEALTAEFFAGAGARGRTRRTVFAVGDEKQSIYSFQGAAPRLFGESRARLKSLATAAEAPFHDLKLDLSFRSTPDVVKAVDAVFAAPTAHRGLATELAPPAHETVRRADPGLVEVWPEAVAEKSPEPENWEDPVDATGPGSPDVVLANRIADTVAGWIRTGERLAANGRRIRAEDVLILVRKRGPFVEAVNRALKQRGVPIAGADRLDVVNHIVARDLIAAARVGLVPEDDLSLAAVAKSPLVGLSEDDLFRLAHGRPGSLIDAVETAAAAGDGAAARLLAAVAAWRRRADAIDPFAFFAALAGPDGARARFRARFGHEADEVIDELLRLALAFEARETPTLQGFLCRIEDTDEDVKREVVEGRDEVRVMTVHGAKGLEAPVVFLVDPGSAPVSGQHDPAVVRAGTAVGAPLVWVAPGVRPAPVEAALAGFRQSQEEEYRRLLYVGLTRARDRLIVAGIARAGKPDGRWHTLVREALAPAAETVTDADGRITAWRWRLDADRPARPPVETAAAPAMTDPLPAFLARRPAAQAAPVVLTPSAAGAGVETAPVRAARVDAFERVRRPRAPAAERGRIVHRLLEVLPDLDPADRRAKAEAFLAREATAFPEEARDAILAAVLAVLDDPAFGAVFGPGGRAEVGLLGGFSAPDGRTIAVSGQVDRLVVGQDAIQIVDYKTNRVVPDAVPDAHVAQLALYRRVLADLHPDRPVTAAILWTEAPRLDPVPPDALDAMLTRLITETGTARDAGRS
ncbi:double-strand break repair helicase AddA [Mongoliimonas terrestris]|uniref:double-strand break repair helicase AddA n=1 Tax=Mongoliimonas terrestris TaxID=1709001 RepID=UPI000ABC6EE4|nr:double-strand break repair helicase AddA [Mongoliimonas terrestris]